jgi:hypothetical protein
MRCLFGVISSEGEGYQKMKDVWINNVVAFNKKCHADVVELYFIEGKQRSDNNLYQINDVDANVYCFQANCEETFKNILRKSLIFLGHVSKYDIKNEKGEYTFTIRSNLSTLFNFEKLFEYLHEVNLALQMKGKENFLGGSFIDKYCAKRTYFSGTNLTFTLPVIKTILENYKQIMVYKDSEGDDVLLSSLALELCDNLLMRDMKRMDLCKEVIFNSCDAFDDTIFCYRFKTDSRSGDAESMAIYLKHLYSGLTVKEEFVQFLNDEPPYQFDTFVHIKNKGYINTFTRIFFLHKYTYRGIDVVYPEFL